MRHTHDVGLIGEETLTERKMNRIHRHQHHLVWDNSIPPILTVDSGEIATFDWLDASIGQIDRHSTDETFNTLDFSKIN